MLLPQIIYLIILLPLLSMHVAGDASADLEALLNSNKMLDAPSNEDEIEFNDERSKLEAAKDKNDDEKKVAIRNFEVYLKQREFYKDTISKILNAGPAITNDLENSLKTALNDRNDNKRKAIDEAFTMIADKADDPSTNGSNMPYRPGMYPATLNIDMQALLKLLDSLRLPPADFLSKLLSNGGTVLSPSINQLYTGYNPIPLQHHADNNDNKKVKDLLKTILDKVELITGMNDDDDFDWFGWLL